MEAAIRAKREQLEKLDARLSVNVDFLAGKQRLEDFAQHPVELKGSFTTHLSEAGEAIHPREQPGIQANFQVTNFHVDGSPLLEDLGVNVKEGLLTLSHKRKR